MMKRMQNGFSMIESLVALIVLSLGLLGAAGMQMKVQQFNRSSYYYTQATVLAHDMVERMRANAAALQDGDYHLPTSKKYTQCYTSAGCTPLQMAQNDIYEWSGIGESVQSGTAKMAMSSAPSSTTVPDTVATKLPAGSGIVCIDSTPDDGTADSSACDGSGNVYAIKIWWANQDANEQRVVTTVAFR